jgi:hypothetical protein
VIAEALDGTMATIEARMETKVRKGYQHDNRVSPNMAYAKFVHGESRLVVGIPDHHYHIHVFAMNATFSTPSKVAFVANTCRRKRGRSDKAGKIEVGMGTKDEKSRLYSHFNEIARHAARIPASMARSWLGKDTRAFHEP